ncbi:MAG: biotin/lipoyl-containing protein [Bryobacteraceae bacterium]
MKTMVEVDGRGGTLQWDRTEQGSSFALELEATAAQTGVARILEVEPGIYSVLLNGRSYEAKIVPGADGDWYVDVDGRHYAIGLTDPREQAPGVRGQNTDGRQNLKAAMPGKVVRVLAAVGDEVSEGQGLVVVEAMKMQNELKAPRAGTVVLMNAREGMTVTAGEMLAAIE